MLSLQSVTNHELDALYTHMKRDFPMNERLPRFMLVKGVTSGVLDALYLLDNGVVCGYALCIFPEDPRFVHIQYLAVLPEFRSKGYGSDFLQLLIERYPDRDLILEVENPAAAKDDAEYETRNKRIAFYKRSGFRVQKGVRLRLFGVEMLLMARTDQLITGHRELWKQCYRKLLPARWLAAFVHVYADPEFGAHAVRPGIYRHFRGGEYEVLFLAKHSETMETLVVYRSLTGDGGYWARPVSMWSETVLRDNEPVRRFTRIKS